MHPIVTDNTLEISGVEEKPLIVRAFCYAEFARLDFPLTGAVAGVPFFTLSASAKCNDIEDNSARGNEEAQGFNVKGEAAYDYFPEYALLWVHRHVV